MQNLLLFLLNILFFLNMQDTNYNKLILEHKAKYEFMTVQDVYKLLFQSIYGVKHLLHDTTASKKYLLYELNSIDAKKENLYENISPDSMVYRINLKTFKYRKLSPDTLFLVMKLSAAEINGNDIIFERAWKEFSEMIIEKEVPFSSAEISNFSYKVGDTIKEMHHSDIYTKKYLPNYRVVKKDIFQKYFPGEKE